jgi:hypothetical protein
MEPTPGREPTMNHDIFATMPADLRAELAALASVNTDDKDRNAGRELLAAMLRDSVFSAAVSNEVARRA